jgi:mono/diheme cytochrome c family protein
MPITRKRAVFALIIISLTGLAAAGWYFMAKTRTGRIDANNAQLVALGKQVYGQACASCHGANLEGQANWMDRGPDGKLPAPPHDATGHTWHHSDADLFKIVKDGVQAFAGPDYKTDMPAFAATLTDQQIDAAIAYIKSTWPEKQRKYQEQVSEQATKNTGG